jgi:hypothetical protein
VNARESFQQGQELQQSMIEEVREIIQDAKKRPITDDEATILLWHVEYH